MNSISLRDLVDDTFPEYLLERPQSAKELAMAMVGIIAKRKINNIRKKNKYIDLSDEEVENTIINSSLLDSITEMGALKERVDRSQAYVMQWANASAAYLYEEADTLEEWLMAKLSSAKHPSEISDLAFLVDKALPALSKIDNVDIDEILQRPGFYSRIKQTVPYWRAAHKQYEQSTKKEAHEKSKIERKLEIRERRMNATKPGTKAWEQAKTERDMLQDNLDEIDNIIKQKSEDAAPKYIEAINNVIDVVTSNTPRDNIKSVLFGTGPSLIGYKTFNADGSITYTITVTEPEGAYIETQTSGIDWRIGDRLK